VAQLFVDVKMAIVIYQVKVQLTVAQPVYVMNDLKTHPQIDSDLKGR